MKTTRKIISLSSDLDDSVISNVLQPGTILANRFKILILLKNDSFITSYACDDLDLKETVVVYVIPENFALNNEVRSKLELYINDLASLESENVFTNYQLVSLSPKELFVVARYPLGNNIKQWQNAHNIDSQADRLTLKRLLLEAATGLDYLHSHGMLHGSVIPENMLVTNENTLLLVNTGITSCLQQQPDRGKKKYGANEYLNYQAPELWNNSDPNAKTEQYALAATVYELISGKKPYDWVRSDLLKTVISTQEPDPPTGATKKECSAIMRALAHNPKNRYSTCRRFVKSLTPFKPSPMQIKICAACIIVLFLIVGGITTSHVISQFKERARIAHLAEEAKAEKLRQEVELQKRIRDAGQLQWQAKEILAEILSRNFDEGQTFGEHIKAAQIQYAEGEKAMAAGQRAEAFAFFSESFKSSEWVRNNAASRVAVRQIMNRILAMRADDRWNAKNLLLDKWENALDKCNAAISAFEAGNFSQAEMLFKETETTFLRIADAVKTFMKKQYVEFAENALQDRNWSLVQEYAEKMEAVDSELSKKYHEKASEGIKRSKIASELLAIQKAKELADWHSVILHCNNILELDENNAEAKKMLEEAALASTCNLYAKPQINSEVIACSIEINGKKIAGDTTELIRNLPYNVSNKLRFVGMKDGVQYEWTGTIDCNWKGVHTSDFNLEPSAVLLRREAQNALANHKWEELLSLANQLLQFELQSKTALQFKEKAELELSCNAEIIPLVNDSKIKAEFYLDSQKHSTETILRNLLSGKEYILELIADQDGIQFEGKCEFRADWKGVKQITVVMQKNTDVLLLKAQEALKKQDWTMARKYSQKVLELLPGDVDASRILEKAELQLTSNLKLKAMLNGREVDADIAGSVTSQSTANMVRLPNEGAKYHFELTYIYGGKTYKGHCAITCDWIGLKEVEVALQDEFARLANYAELLKTEEKWQNLLQVAKQMFELENDNKIAKNYLKLAEINTTKCLQILPKLHSKLVTGIVHQYEGSYNTIKIRQIGETSSVLRNLSPEFHQKFSVTYTDGTDDYWGNLEINENWKGIRTMEIVLKKLNPTRIPIGDGTFRMVKVDSEYWIGNYEITQAQYKVVTGEQNPSKYAQINTNLSFAGEPIYKSTDSHPVENVTWNDAQEFCELLTEQCLKAGLIPPTLQFSLPTVLQWKKALFMASELKNMQEQRIKTYCWFSETSSKVTHQVGTKSATADLYDMLGNVSEWCSDATNSEAASMGGNFDSDISDIMKCLSEAPKKGVVWTSKKGNSQTGFRIVLMPKNEI